MAFRAPIGVSLCNMDRFLLDINMPFMDGIELLSRIHEEYPGTETVIFSGYDEFSYAKKAISYGVSAYILKPVNPEEFEKVVGEINEKLAKSEREEKRKDESMEFLREHLLYLMVNGQSRSPAKEIIPGKPSFRRQSIPPDSQEKFANGSAGTFRR